MELEPKFGQIIHKTKSTYYNTATPRLQWNKSQNLVILYTRQSLHTTTQLLQGSSGTRAKILVKLYTRQSLHTSTQLIQGSSGTRAKIWSNYTQDKVYILQHSYSKAAVELEPKFGQIIHKTKSTYYNTATPRLQWNKSQNLVKLYTRQSLHTTTQLLQGCSGTRAKIWSNYTQDKVYILQHSYSKAAVELEPKFGQIIHKTKSTYYNTATPRLQWNKSQNLVKLYTRQSLHTTTQLLQGCSGTRAKIWSNYTQDKVYILQHSYSKAPVEQEPKFGHIIHKTKSTYYNTATPRLQRNQSQNFGQIIHKTKSTYFNAANPRLQWNKSQNLVKLYTRQSLHTTTQLLQGCSGTRAKIWSNYTQDKVYILQHSYSKAPVEQEPKFGQIIHKTKSTYYNTATPRLQWN